MTEITGTINEIRKTFTGDGISGKVEFGSIDRRIGYQFVRVKLDDGRQAWGKYRNAGDVRLRLKAIYNKFGKRIG